MANQQPQQYSNHARLVTGFHYVAAPIVLAVIIGGVVNVIKSSPENFYSACLILALSVATMLIAFFARSFALKAQDRAIRSEENFRHYLLTGKPLPNGLRMSQIVALRFAADAEFADLTKKAAAEDWNSKQIKTAIQQWKADYNRV